LNQLRSLRVFVQVISDGSFAGAARTLDLAPAVVTRSVSDLEDHLGVRLLNRTTRSLALTEAGEAYLERAKLVLSALDEADSLASAINDAPAGNLRILCPPAFATHQLVPRLPAFRLRYPGIQIEMSAVGPVGSADENFDVSIVSVGQQPFQGDFVVRQLASSRFIVCAAPDYLARSRPILQPLDLLPHDVLFPQVAAVRRELTLYSETLALNPSEEVLRVHLHPPVISTSQLEVLYAAALAGMGVAGLPTFMVADALQDGRLTRVLPDWHGGALQLYAAMPTRKHVPTRTRAFIDFLVEAFGGTQKDPWLGLT
jgi:DNA-binding transcriptional LysR family regulator